ncbi:hypothetical protein [Vreelandella arctica]|uniref:hypothetical protein n=1 Tax=Vreelandella arctica TaxID=3126499 RepID=UPI00300E2444
MTLSLAAQAIVQRSGGRDEQSSLMGEIQHNIKRFETTGMDVQMSVDYSTLLELTGTSLA